MRGWHGQESEDAEPLGRGPAVVAVGVFDGVHRGHQEVLRRAGGHARRLGLPVVAVTFDPHPLAVLRPEAVPDALTTVRRRVELLRAHGAAEVDVLPFTPELARTPPDEFAAGVLADRWHAAAVVVGADFRFGHRAAGDVDELRTLGEKYHFTVDAVPLLGDPEPVSSNRVRAAVARGDVAGAAADLGREHRLEGVVVHGAARGRELLGFPTANLSGTPGAAVPADGVYAGWLSLLPEERGGAGARAESRWPAAVSVGTNPQFDGTVRTVEAYALDRDDLDLYGRAVAVEFTARIRGQQRFDSVDALIAAMDRDVDRAREILSRGQAPGDPDSP
ncbi:bifunctional riboflavin kinase/FAD synthetase [Marinitenerispora sediminis]|uniref:Riboflavin biosynthesis protein n=1 Tax=Marinitenerispora sediminis TaxID=1931232 RepID=A0A368T5L0_9ACTN|nr:bifunctional riboflavin kinase/FAD synthetase [Marinitenerispora sediminis]RCV53085.1 bifunctional riboflavin kinase/FMN adenylyltransferase [Marinitenerispora sediminis]RCV58539.1 bifunctional riboflavin kinase/FMN adenylyltransferase [Marinitenerispora sediminis]RCV58662.1 bifunctional riboflavin kinase/FMN adenylyltransferase [Marinitenerispora sediminis]